MKRIQKKKMKISKVVHFESIQKVQKNNQVRQRMMMTQKASESKWKLIMKNIIIFKINFADFEKLPEFSNNEIFESRTSELLYFI